MAPSNLSEGIRPPGPIASDNLAISAIDVHVHVHDKRARQMRGPDAEQRDRERATYFKGGSGSLSLEEQAEQYRERNMMAVLMNGTDETITGIPPIPNDFMAEAVGKHPDVFLAFG